MLQAGGGLDLHHEAVGTQYRGELRLRHLERDSSVVLHVVGEVDRRHPARAEVSFDPVATGERDGETIGDGVSGASPEATARVSLTVRRPLAERGRRSEGGNESDPSPDTERRTGARHPVQHSGARGPRSRARIARVGARRSPERSR